LSQAGFRVRFYPSIPDFIDSVLTEHGYRSWKQVNSNAEAVNIRLEALRHKISQEVQNPKFISDKSVIDYFAYWQLNTVEHASLEDQERFESAVTDHLRHYDLILLLLWGRMGIEPTEARQADRCHQFRVHSEITGWMLRLRAPFAVFDQFVCARDADLRKQVENLASQPNPTSLRQIGLFIGTFDPPTNGHLACALRALEFVDEVWFCPNPDNPTCPREHQPLAHRARMLALLAQGVWDRSVTHF